MSKEELDRLTKRYSIDKDPDDLGVLPIEDYPEGWEDVPFSESEPIE